MVPLILKFAKFLIADRQLIGTFFTWFRDHQAAWLAIDMMEFTNFHGQNLHSRGAIVYKCR